jgi:hypothetical protein
MLRIVGKQLTRRDPQLIFVRNYFFLSQQDYNNYKEKNFKTQHCPLFRYYFLLALKSFVLV